MQKTTKKPADGFSDDERAAMKERYLESKANKADGEKIVCFFQGAFKFKARYATFGFSDAAKLDEGNMWPTSFALKKLTSVEEKQIVAVVRMAVE